MAKNKSTADKATHAGKTTARPGPAPKTTNDPALLEEEGQESSTPANLVAVDPTDKDVRATTTRPAKAKVTKDTPQGGTFALLSGTLEDLDPDTGERTLYTYEGPDAEPVMIESKNPLDIMFMNKVRRVNGPTHPGRDLREMAEPGLMDPPTAYKYPAGIKSQMSGEQEKAAAAAQKQQAKAQPAAAEDDGFGDDVTDDFDEAEDAGVKVFQSGKGKDRRFHVMDADVPDTPLNADEELTNVKAVRTFIKEKAG